MGRASALRGALQLTWLLMCSAAMAAGLAEEGWADPLTLRVASCSPTTINATTTPTFTLGLSDTTVAGSVTMELSPDASGTPSVTVAGSYAGTDTIVTLTPAALGPVAGFVTTNLRIKSLTVSSQSVGLGTISSFTPSVAADLVRAGLTTDPWVGPTDRTYHIGESLVFTATFTETVTSSGSLTLKIEDAAGTRDTTLTTTLATLSGTASWTLPLGGMTFHGASGLKIKELSGTIVDAAGNQTALATPAPAPSWPLTIDTQRPAVSGWTGPTDRTYHIGENIVFTATFTETVTSSGSLTLKIEDAAGTRDTTLTTTLATLSGTASWTLPLGGMTFHGASGLKIKELSGTIVDAATNQRALATPAPVPNWTLTIDTQRPSVSGWTGPTDRMYHIGENLVFTATFTEAVTASGSLTLKIVDATGTRDTTLTTTLATLSGTASWTLPLGNMTFHGAPGVKIKELSGTIVDAATNQSVLVTPAPAPSWPLTIDTQRPAVSGWTGPTDRTYHIGENIVFTATFTETVTSSGSLTLKIEDAAGTRDTTLTTTLATLSGTASWTLPLGGMTFHGASGLKIKELSGTIVDAATNQRTLATPAPVPNWTLTIDTQRPSVSGWTGPTDRMYHIGENLVFTATFTEAVTSSGALTLKIEDATGTRDTTLTTTLATLSGTASWTLPLGNMTFHGAPGVKIKELSGTIVDAATNQRVLATPAPVPGWSLTIDTQRPTVTTLTCPIGTRKLNDNLTIPCAFSEDVKITNALDLECRGNDSVPYHMTSPAGTTYAQSHEFFDSQLTANEVSTDRASDQLTLFLLTGTIEDQAGNSAALSVSSPAPGSCTILIDTVVPSIDFINSTCPSSNRRIGDDIVLMLGFSEQVSCQAGLTACLKNSGDGTQLCLGPASWADRVSQKSLTKTLAVNSFNVIPPQHLTVASIVGDIQDRAGNTMSYSGTPAQPYRDCGEIRIDTTPPTPPLAACCGATYCGPSDGAQQCSITATDNGGAVTYSGTFAGINIQSNGQLGFTPSDIASGGYVLQAAATDLVGNGAAMSCTITIDNQRVDQSAGEGFQDPFGSDEIPGVIPAGWPVVVNGVMCNQGSCALNATACRVSLSGTSGADTDTQIQGYDLPPNCVPVSRPGTLTCPATAASGNGTLRFEHAVPLLEDGEVTSIPVQIKTMNAVLSVTFSDYPTDEIVAGQNLRFGWSLQQNRDGGVTSHPRVTASRPTGTSLGDSATTTLTDDAGLVLKSGDAATGPHAKTTPWMVPISADDGTDKIVITQNDFCAAADQTGGVCRGQATSSLDVSVKSPQQQSGSSVQLTVVNANVTAPWFSSTEDGSRSGSLYLPAGQKSKVYIVLENVEPRVNPVCRLSITCQASQEAYYQSPENTTAGWVDATVHPAGRHQFLYRPGGQQQFTLDVDANNRVSVPLWIVAGDSDWSDTIIAELTSERFKTPKVTVPPQAVQGSDEYFQPKSLCLTSPSGPPEAMEPGELVYTCSVGYEGGTTQAYVVVSGLEEDWIKSPPQWEQAPNSFQDMVPGPEAGEYRTNRTGFTVSSSSTKTFRIRVQIEEGTPDGSSAGIGYAHAKVVRCRPDGTPTEPPLDETLEQVNQCRWWVTVMNERLVYRLSLLPGQTTTARAGQPFTCRISVKNVGSASVMDGQASATVGAVYADWVATGTPPSISGLSSLGPNQSTPEQDWVLTLKDCAGDFPAKSLKDFFVYQGWGLMYDPVCLGPAGCAVGASDVDDANTVVTITTAELAATVTSDPGWVEGSTGHVPTGSTYTVTVDVGNQDDLQDGEFRAWIEPIPGLNGNWGSPTDSAVTVPPGSSATKEFAWTVDLPPGQTFDLSSNLHLSMEPCALSQLTQIGPMTVDSAAIVVSPESVPESVDLTAHWNNLAVAYHLANMRTDQSVPISIRFYGPDHDPGAGNLRLDGVTFAIGENEPESAVNPRYATSPTDWLQWAGGPLISMPPGASGTLRVNWSVKRTAANGTKVDPGAVYVGFEETQSTSFDVPEADAVLMRNLQLRPLDVVASDPAPLADDTVTYTFSLANQGEALALADSLTVWVTLAPPGGLVWDVDGSTSSKERRVDPTNWGCTAVFRVPRDYVHDTPVAYSSVGAELSISGPAPPPLTATEFGLDLYEDVRPENVHFTVTSATRTPDDTTVSAGQKLDLSLTVGNESRKPAEAVTCSFEAVLKDESGVEHSRDSLSSGPFPIPASPGTATFGYEIPLHADMYPPRYKLSFENIRVNAAAQGSNPPRNPGPFPEELGSPEIKNVKLQLSVKRLESLQGAAGGSGDVSKGDPVYYGLFVQNLGNADQAGALKVVLIGTKGIAFGDRHPPSGVTWEIKPGAAEDTLTFSIGDAQIGSNSSGDWLIGGYVPAFTINTDALGGERLLFSDGKIEGHVAGAVGGVRNTVVADYSTLPVGVNVTDCSPSDLSITLEQDGEQTVFAGDSLGIRVLVDFAKPGSLPIYGKLTVLCTLQHEEFRVLGAQRVSTNPTAGAVEWSELERSVRIESRMLEDGGTGTSHEEWRIWLMRNLGPGTEASVPVLNLLDVVPTWDATGDTIRCGLDDDVPLRNVTQTDLVRLAAGHGQVVTFFARPNPATDEVAICYDLLDGVTSVRLIVSDLAGNVILAAKDPDLPLGNGLRVLRWKLKADNVPNGTYLCKLEVKGADDRGRSLNETRRMKLAVLR